MSEGEMKMRAKIQIRPEGMWYSHATNDEKHIKLEFSTSVFPGPSKGLVSVEITSPEQMHELVEVVAEMYEQSKKVFITEAVDD